MSYYFYTETAFHHEGDCSYLKKLIDLSFEVGSNGIKFQVLFELNSLISSTHSNYSDLRRLIIPPSEWRSVFDLSIEKGLDIIAMPLDCSVFDFFLDYKKHIKYLELHSVSFNDYSLKKRIKESKIPLILGSGGRTLKEIDSLISFFGNQVEVLMHGFQSFPSKIENIRLDKISFLASKYPDLKIGFADHSSFDDDFSITSNEYAYLLGARVFEKHITLNEGVKRIDYESSLGSDKLKLIIDKLNFLDTQIFKNKNDFSILNDYELKYRRRQKIAVASKKIKKGEFFSQDNVAFKMSDTQSDLNDFSLLINKKSTVDLYYDDVILEKNVT